LKHGKNISTMCPNYILAFIASLSMHVGHHSNCHRTMFVKLLVIPIIVFKRCCCTYCSIQGYCFICSDL